MKKVIKLINNERTDRKILAASACDSTHDFCAEEDHAECSFGSYDLCVKDLAGCTNHSYDYCSGIYDIHACSVNNATDY